jgi:hypothetical protein
MQQRSRLLLPFTHGLNCLALDYAVKLAKSRDMILIPLSLIAVPANKPSKGARLEFIQQSQDFLVAVQQKAEQLSVPVEACEVYTSDVIDSINDVAHRRNCEGVLLFVRHGDGILLRSHEVSQVLTKVAGTHNIIHLPGHARVHSPQTLMQWFSGLWHGQGKQHTVTGNRNVLA